MFQRNNGIYFIQNNVTGKQESLKTRDKAIAVRLSNARNEAHQQPAINIQIAKAYLAAADKELSALLALVPIVRGTTYEALREVGPLLDSRSGLSTAEAPMADGAARLAELLTL